MCRYLQCQLGAVCSHVLVIRRVSVHTSAVCRKLPCVGFSRILASTVCRYILPCVGIYCRVSVQTAVCRYITAVCRYKLPCVGTNCRVSVYTAVCRYETAVCR